MWKYTKAIAKLIFILIYDCFSRIFKYSNHPEKYPLEERYKKVRKLVIQVLNAFNVEIKDHNFDKFNENNKKNRLIVCNHISILDPLLIIAKSEKPISFACKKEIKKMPIVNRIVRAINGVFLDRKDLKQQLKVMREIEYNLVNTANLDWCIFPEGTRNKKPFGEIHEFHHGTFRCATKSGSDIVLVSMFNTFRILDIKDKAKKYIVPLHYLKTITLEEYKNVTTNILAVECNQIINEQVLKDIENLYPNS